jgi:voltage-gated potassium channel
MKSPSASAEPAPPVAGPGYLEVAVILASIYALIALAAQAMFPFPARLTKLFDGIDAVVCLVFLSDFVVHYRRAPSKAAFMKWGWIDLLSSIPLLESFRWGRAVRLVRVLRVFRGIRAGRCLAALFLRDRSKGVAFFTAVAAVALVIFSSITILTFETLPTSTIRTPFDALWWSVTTMTTVGYGDKIPISVEGKVAAMLLMIFGVALFGVLIGLMTQFLVEPELKREDADIANLVTEVRLLREKIDRLQPPQSAPPEEK